MAEMVVERKQSKRGRKAIVKAGMKALAESWNSYKIKKSAKGKGSTWNVGDTIVLPDCPEIPEDANASELHSILTLARYHFRKYAEKEGLKAGVDYTIESHPAHGATITRLK